MPNDYYVLKISITIIVIETMTNVTCRRREIATVSCRTSKTIAISIFMLVGVFR